MQACATISFSRHAEIMQCVGANVRELSQKPIANYVLEHCGSIQQAKALLAKQLEFHRELCKDQQHNALYGVELPAFFFMVAPCFAAGDLDDLNDDGLKKARPEILSLLHANGCTSAEACGRWYSEGVEWQHFKAIKMRSRDGRIQFGGTNLAPLLLCALLSLASSDAATANEEEEDWLNGLPSESDRGLTDLIVYVQGLCSFKALAAEVFERAGRLEGAIRWAQANANEPSEQNFNVADKVRSARLLGRVHAAKGEHALSLAAFDVALSLTGTGGFVLGSVFTVRERALVGKAAGGAGGHWPEGVGRERLAEAVARMEVPTDQRPALVARLLAPRLLLPPGA
jgi:hypothetical protein